MGPAALTSWMANFTGFVLQTNLSQEVKLGPPIQAETTADQTHFQTTMSLPAWDTNGYWDANAELQKMLQTKNLRAKLGMEFARTTRHLWICHASFQLHRWSATGGLMGMLSCTLGFIIIFPIQMVILLHPIKNAASDWWGIVTCFLDNSWPASGQMGMSLGPGQMSTFSESNNLLQKHYFIECRMMHKAELRTALQEASSISIKLLKTCVFSVLELSSILLPFSPRARILAR